MKLDLKTSFAHGSPAVIAAALSDIGVRLPIKILEDFASPSGLALVVRKPDGSSAAFMRTGDKHWNVALPEDVLAILYSKGLVKIIKSLR